MFRGAGVAIVTPFKNGSVDYESFEGLLEFQLEHNTQALVVLGTTGEAPTIYEDEREKLIQVSVEKAGGRVPVIIGTGTNNTEDARKHTIQAEKLGADGVLVVTPYYNKCTQKGLVAHYEEIAGTTSLPIILYNVPGRTGVNINPETVAELAKIENVIGIKEACGNISQVLEVRRVVPDDFIIWSGNDDNILPIYSVGGQGVISVMANLIPGETQAMCEAFMEGRVQEAIDLQVKYKKMITLLFIEANPIPIKAALSLMGMLENDIRLPLTKMEPEHMDQLKKEMIRLGILQ